MDPLQKKQSDLPCVPARAFVLTVSDLRAQHPWQHHDDVHDLFIRSENKISMAHRVDVQGHVCCAAVCIGMCLLVRLCGGLNACESSKSVLLDASTSLPSASRVSEQAGALLCLTSRVLFSVCVCVRRSECLRSQ